MAEVLMVLALSRPVKAAIVAGGLSAAIVLLGRR